VAILTVSTTHDYSGDTLADITNIVFDTSAAGTQATFAASQFDGVQISQSVTVTGDDNLQCRFIVKGIDGTFSTTGWTFDVLVPEALFVQLEGSSNADTITGSSDVLGAFIGGGGADILTGGDQNDVFAYFDGTDVAAGETITAGAGSVDWLQVDCDSLADNFDFTTATISGIEEVIFSGVIGEVTTVTFSGDQVGAGKITSFDSNDPVNVSVKVIGSTVDLTGVSGTQINVVGTTGNDSLTGSSAPDTIAGDLGRDTMTGGLGSADIFDFNLKTDSKKGANRDVITDFSRTDLDQIDLIGIDAKKGAGNQAFVFIGKQQFHDKKGELHFVKKAGFLIVEGDINGDGRADFQIEVHGIGKLIKADFDL
jgi:Ca2+-binding RTX toxin-like protein